MRRRCPYVVGNTIKLQIEERSYPPDRAVSATITKLFEPFTLSSVMLALLDSPPCGLEGYIVLKIFDRRFATQLREDEGILPWTLDIEREYQDFVVSGGASEFIAQLRSRNNMADEEGEHWTVAQKEAYLHHYMQKLYDAETKVYERVQDIQGRDVPKLLVTLTVPGQHLSLNSFKGIDNYINYPGILLEYIQGFKLNELTTHAPRETWQYICEDALRIVNTIGDRGIRNEDVKTRNFLVRRDPIREVSKVFMIDFALCEFRRQDQDEREWRQWKAIQDEEGAVGYVMQRLLKGGFVYCRSPLYLKLDEDFRME